MGFSARAGSSTPPQTPEPPQDAAIPPHFPPRKRPRDELQAPCTPNTQSTLNPPSQELNFPPPSDSPSEAQLGKRCLLVFININIRKSPFEDG